MRRIEEKDRQEKFTSQGEDGQMGWKRDRGKKMGHWNLPYGNTISSKLTNSRP